jgi:tetratricopeptide (TPR) repeat protein
MAPRFARPAFDRLHEAAKAFAEQGDLAYQRGRDAEARALYKQALESEQEALPSAIPGDEPCRSALLYNIAHFAFRAGDISASWKYVDEGFKSKPPTEVSGKLEKLLEALLRHAIEKNRRT